MTGRHRAQRRVPALTGRHRADRPAPAMGGRLLAGLAALLLATSTVAGTGFSSAEFTDTSTTPVVVGAAPDWTPPSVAVVDPGYAVNATTTVSATASDSISTIASVEIQYRRAGGSWTSICTDTVAPWSCAWNTTVVADGLVDLRAIATDAEANTATSATVATEVLNAAGIVLAPIPSTLRGIYAFSAKLLNIGVAPSTINFQIAVTGTTTWYDLGCNLAGPTAICTFDTSLAGSGQFDLRAVGTVGTSTYTDVQQGVLFDNTAPTVTLTVPASPLAGTVSLTATATDAQTGVASVVFEYRQGTGAWIACGTDTSAPYACSLATTTLADGTWQFRASATDQAGNTGVSTTTTRTVDNLAPTVTQTVPAAPLGGTVTLSATASDAGSGVASVAFQYRLQGAGTWSSCGTDTTTPYSCALDTTTLGNGTYEFRSVATDLAGRSTTTAVDTRTVDNGAVTVTAPTAGAVIARGASISATATATSPAGVTSVTLQYDPAGATSWTAICVDTVAPYTCTWNTSTIPVGSTGVRAVMRQGNGSDVYSAQVTVTIQELKAWDVQTTPFNDTGTPTNNGKASAGDQIILTYTDQVSPGTIKSGWNGTATPVALSFKDTGVAGSPVSGQDWMDITGANLGQVAFSRNQVNTGATVVFNASTMTASTTTVGGITATVVTITLGTPDPATAAQLVQSAMNGSMTWKPSTAATTAAGIACLATTAVESGSNDVDL